MRISKNNNGVLLLEILIVISILGIVSSVSLPYLRTFSSNLKLSKATKTLSSDLRYAQQLTVSEQVVHYLQIFEVAKKHQIIRSDTMAVIKEEALPEKINFQEITGFTNDKIIFNFYGAVLESGLIILINEQTTKLANINVKPSGYVEYSI
ncbi:Tfp pilus assembly protein FimT/FimU [Patescibacteria group bacterium]